ncbi:MAG: hypothetical protein R3321_14690, partial [Nitrososphaeraceae archaeon]|nr:hypothetical protein [Nitrososphaeraceae archaeon]
NSQMTCKIDFVNSQICSELKNVVSEWYDSLSNNSEDHTFIKFLLRNNAKITYLINFLFLLAGTISLIFLFNYSGYSEESLFISKENKLFTFLMLSVLILYSFYKIGYLFSDRVNRLSLGKIKRNPMFEFTSGDLNKLSEIKKRNNRGVLEVIISIIIGLLINLITYGVGHLIGTLISK